MEENELINYPDLLRDRDMGNSRRRSSAGLGDRPANNQSTHLSGDHYGLTTEEALLRLQQEMDAEISKMNEESSKRTFISWLRESISFESELSKMRWPSVIFMTAQALAHFLVAFISDPKDLATRWVGLQGFILALFLIFNIAINLWDTRLRFNELLMKSKQLTRLIEQCAQDKSLLNRWKRYNRSSTEAKSMFIPKSPCIQQTYTYRDESCPNLPDYLLVKGDIIHLFPGDRSPGDCVSLKPVKKWRPNYISTDTNNLPERLYLKQNEVFEPEPVICNPKIANQEPEALRRARFVRAERGQDFIMLSTPYIKSLRISLQMSHQRPVNSVEKECFIVSRKYFETFVIPSVFVLSTLVTALHYGYLDLADNDHQIKIMSIAYLLLRPSLTIMPFLPWMFPCFWLIVNAYGNARLLCCAESQRCQLTGREPQPASPSSAGWSPGRNSTANQNRTGQLSSLLATPTLAGSSENKQDESDLLEMHSNICFGKLFWLFMDLVRGRAGYVWRSSNLLQVLGCLTSLCCIDKVGILSWSNPTPEKLFLLTRDQADQQQDRFVAESRASSGDNPLSSGHQSPKSQAADSYELLEPTPTTSDNELTTRTKIRTQNSNTNANNTSVSQTSLSSRSDLNYRALAVEGSATQQQRYTIDLPANPADYKPEVLDISHSLDCYRGPAQAAGRLNQAHALGRLHFDDLNWHKHLNSLKPLGLAILMNNCCEASFGDYFRFYKHIAYRSTKACSLTPVVKRRCLCSLSRLIGFTRGAASGYKYCNQIGLYRMSDAASMIHRERLAPGPPGEPSPRLKLPFSNMVCNVHQDLATGGRQLFSQGTADLILDACVDFWDGNQLVRLDESARKKIKDFYHRTSLTASCFAFAYGPLLRDRSLSGHYIELPPDTNRVGSDLRTLISERDEQYLQNQIMAIPGKPYTPVLPVDDSEMGEVYSDEHDDIQSNRSSMQATSQAPTLLRARRHLSAENMATSGASIAHASKSSRLTDVMDEITDQVFVGMVSLQYQACPDFVALVEQLEHACIRFVHFSKENELRSRVFSEKMGLESGWNCHISLQSDERLLDFEHQELSTGLRRHSIVPDSILDDELKSATSRLGNKTPSTRISDLLGSGGSTRRSADADSSLYHSKLSLASLARASLNSWKSLPSLIMSLATRLAKSRGQQQAGKLSSLVPSECQQQPLTGSSHSNDHLDQEQADSEQPTSELGTGAGAINANTINSGPEYEQIAFDMSNRAKLPKGIENIRPHLEMVDNVPLQVSLFTDCTPDLTKEMIEIMQEYGEIVCIIGSASSRQNTPIFLQANASIAIEPLVPQCCAGLAEIEPTNKSSGKSKLQKRRSHRKARHTRRDRRPAQAKYEVPEAARPTNPRDRLGFNSGAEQPQQPVPTVGRRQRPRRARKAHHLSSSSSSASNSSSRASSPSHSEFTRSSHSASLSASESRARSLRSSSYVSSCSASSSSSSSSSSSNSTSAEDGSSDNELNSGFKVGRTEHAQSSELASALPVPSALACKLASLPCSYSFNRNEPVNLYSLIMEARHFTFKMKNTFVCMICFALSISSAQFLASILFLPPMLSAGLTIWLTIVVVPLMSFSLMNATMDTQVMKIAVGKNLQLKPENITFFVICYLIKFIPSVIVAVLSFGLIIDHSCKLTGFGAASLGPCWMFTYVKHNATTSTLATTTRSPLDSSSPPSNDNDDDLWSAHLLTAQVCAAFLMVLYFVVISAGFVHRDLLLWQRSPTRNRIWTLVCLALLLGQLAYNQLVLQIDLGSSQIPHNFLASLPAHIWIISFTWPVLIIAINILVKRAEIKATIRQQRRARFDFNTKLGMNSPF